MLLPSIRVLTGLLCLALLSTACATRGRLVPLKGKSSTVTVAAEGAAKGITVEVRPNAWSGVPERLRKVTPVLVIIENQHSERIRLRYNEFTLKAADGREYHALPPFDIKGTQVRTLSPAFPIRRFLLAPYQSTFFPGWPRFQGAFAYDPLYFQTYYTAFRRHRLPTSDMLVRALPEGVLDTQGKITGFLYFENIDPDVTKIDFVAQMMSADREGQVAEVRVPFDVR